MKIKYKLQVAMSTLGISELRKHQIEPINSILSRNDVLVISPTASGKSAVFQIPALTEWKKEQRWVLVIEPTLSLIEDQVHKLRKKGIPAEALSSLHESEINETITKLASHQIALLYVTPERIQSSVFQRETQYNCPWLLVVDEAHCVLDWGYTFRRSYLMIKRYLKGLKRRPVIAAFTATAPPEYRETITTCLGMKQPKIFLNSLARKNISLIREDCSALSIKQRLARVNYNIKKYRKDGRVVVYCASRKNVDLVANYLSKKFPGEVVKCHAFMAADRRQKHEFQFINGTKPIIVASTAFGMGIDAEDIRLIVHFNLPLSVIDYYQQIGRAGRDGEKSHAVLLYHPDDIALARCILDKEQSSEQLRTWLNNRLEELVSIVEGDRCLSRQILLALGERSEQNCGRCSNCQADRRKKSED